MPMIQNSTTSPAALRGTPQRGSASASACAWARSSVASARCVIAEVTSAWSASCSMSSTASRSSTSWRAMRSALITGLPSASSAAISAVMVAKSGSPGGSRASMSA